MTEEIKESYKIILELNQRINSLLNASLESFIEDFDEKMQNLIAQKGEYIQKIYSFKQDFPEEFNKLQTPEIKETVKQISTYEEENLRIINEKKEMLSKEMNKINTAEKALSAYKYKKQERPRIVDEKDLSE